MTRETGAYLSAFLDGQAADDTDLAGVKNFLLAYREGIVRLLGAQANTLQEFDPWLDAGETPQRQVAAFDGKGPLEA
jgi:hypothetical protein